MDAITNFITVVVHWNQWPTVWAMLVASGVVSVVLQFLKHKLSLVSDHVITFLLGALSFIAAGLMYAVTTISTNPTILGSHTLEIMAGAMVVYRILVKWGYGVLMDAKAERLRRQPISGTVSVSTATVASDFDS